MINRALEKVLAPKCGQGKAIIITGASQTGKTTLLKSMFSNAPGTLWLNADEPDIQAVFENPYSSRWCGLSGQMKSS